ncbi:protein turtle homolog B [Fundulus diaphanus]
MGSGRSYWQTFAAVVVICHFLTTEGVESEVRGKVGDSVELECRFPPSGPQSGSSSSPHVVEWVRQELDIPVLIQFGSHTPHVHPHFEGRASLVSAGALRLERLQLADQGLYDCRILLLDKPADEVQSSNWTLLSVTAPPAFTKAPPPAVQALVGSRLTLECVANGNPTPTITWLKDGSVIPSTNYQGGVLSLAAVTTQSAGLYACHASNSEGNVSRVTKVKIKGPPVIIVPPENTTLNMSQNALLQCQAVADPPNMTYVWQKGSENVHHIESLKSRVRIQVDGTLHISRLVPEDSGNYTCVPTNGLLTPPTASAVLTVMHPAKALSVPQETYLPTGMGGVIPCPAAAQPPLLRVDWIKDGETLDLSLYPGWTLKADGSLVMATVNEDAAGTYTCTPYNSYGTMGPSGPTRVILQDPPSFSITPEKAYRLDAGRKLLIPCQGNADATTKVTWSKVDPVRLISYSIEPNGSLLLQPLIKDHQGEWECTVSNRVASINTRTQVFVLGTSPHAASSLSVSPEVKQANLSWEAGFDGGSAQTFSVWVKKISVGDNDGKQDWFSLPVPSSSGNSLQVSGLSPATNYQFSILSQNKYGTGPFSEIATARTLDPPVTSTKPKPPASLSANQSSAGVILQWSLPEAQQPPITGFVLQSRSAEEEWFNLKENINASSSQILVAGLQKDHVYELRMLSRRGELLSEPSPSVNVSITGIESYPATSRLLEFVPEPLLAGVLGGIGFMLLALILLLGSACVVSRRRDRRRKKNDNEALPAIYKCPPSIKASGSSSPDSLLKKSLLPASSLYPTMSSTTSSQTDCSSLSTENNRQRRNLESIYSRSRLSKTTSLISPSIELISRGPDGRFTLSDFDTMSVDSKKIPRVRRSVSLHLEKEDKKDLPYVLSVDVPPFKPEDDSSQMCSMVQLRPHQESIGSPDQSSLYSNCSLGTMPRLNRGLPSVFPVLPHLRASLGQPSTTASTLVLQMEHEREKGNLSRCLRLAQERKELERELQWCTLERNSMKVKTGPTETSNVEESDGKFMFREYTSKTLPNNYRQGGKEKSSNLTSSLANWETHSFDSRSSFNPFREHMNTLSPLSPSLSPYSPESFSKHTLLQPNGARHSLVDKSTLLHQRCKGVETAPGFDNPRRFTYFDHQAMDSLCKPQKENILCNGPVPDSTRLKEMLTEPTGKELYVEMSVDEPESEEPTLQPTKPMLHHRIASHVQNGCSLSQRSRHEDMRRSTSFNCSMNASVDNFDRVHYSQQPTEPELWKVRSRGLKTLDRKQRSQSLDLRRQKKCSFLTPNAWIDSLSQENCSVELSHKTTKMDPHLPPAVEYLSPTHSPPVMSPNPDVPYYYQPSPSANAANHSTSYQDTTNQLGYVSSLKEVPTYLPPVNNDLEALEVASGGYEGVPESGGSYSSYASSGRGSMETNNGRLSLCHLSPTLTQSLETPKDTMGRSEDTGQTELKQRRQPSVDENYEWDAADICSEPTEEDGILPMLNPQKPAVKRSLPSMPRSKKAQKCSSELSSLPGHQSRCSAEPEPAAVLF